MGSSTALADSSVDVAYNNYNSQPESLPPGYGYDCKAFIPEHKAAIHILRSALHCTAMR